MTALKPSFVSSLAIFAHAKVAAEIDASVPAIVLGGDGRTLRFLNAAAAHVLGITDARPALGEPAPLDDAVCKHLQRVTAGSPAGRKSTERVRYYRGIKPVVLRLTVEPFDGIDGETALLVTLPELAQSNIDSGLQATLDLYGSPDDLVAVFSESDVLAVSGDRSAFEEAPAEIEALAEWVTNDPVETTHINVPLGRRPVTMVRLSGGSSAKRLMYIGPAEPMPLTAVPDMNDAAGRAEAEPQVDAALSGPEPGFARFTFDPIAKPQRFTWELDHTGQFVAVSPEFALTLGPAVTPKIGESWGEVTDRLGLDAGAAVANLLEKRQIWHGARLEWPAEGAALRVPVDLTAMPTSGPDKQFAGFRGFGVIRPGGAIADPLETGLRLAAGDESGPIEPVPEPPILDPASDPLPTPEAKFPRLVPPSQDSDENFVTLMPQAHISPETLRLTGAERNAFRQIAEALGARFEGDDDLMASPPLPDPAPKPDSAIGQVRILSTQDLMDELNRPAAVDVPLPIAHRRSSAASYDTTLVDRLPIAVALTRDEAIIHVNPSFLTLTGYETLDDLNRAGGLDMVFAGPHAAEDWSEDRSRHHIPLVTRSGRVLPVDARIASVPWDGGTAVLMTLLAPDRPGATVPDAGSGALREALAASEARTRELELILDSASDGILTLSASGRIVSANKSADALFGSAPGTLVDRHIADLMAPESRRATTEYIDGLARNGIGSLLLDGRELLAQVSPDRQIPLFATITKIAATPEPLFAAVFRDIGRWKTSEEELTLAKRRAEEASVQKSDFLAKISHEIRTPLNAIIGFSEVILGERFGAIGVERYKDYLRDIQSSGTHIMSLVNDLLDLSKVESGKLDLKFEAVQLIDILAECVQLMQPQASRERVIIRASLTQGLPPVVADHRSIRQIVLNLLSNAIKFTPAGGQVIVSAALEESNEVVIRVRDTGYGMSPNDIEIALEPFRQVHNARGRNTGPGAGTGLGLPLTKALVEANRAALKIDSAVNQGTLVQVTFPAPRVLAAE